MALTQNDIGVCCVMICQNDKIFGVDQRGTRPILRKAIDQPIKAVSIHARNLGIPKSFNGLTARKEKQLIPHHVCDRFHFKCPDNASIAKR